MNLPVITLLGYPTPKDFLEKVYYDTECTIWLGSKGQGYGSYRFKGKSYAVHRLSYIWFKGPIKNGYEIHHTCGIRFCINPIHLLSVTCSEHKIIDGGSGNRDKIICIRGHIYDNTNTYYYKGMRRCRLCRNLWQRGYMERKKKEVDNFGT